MPHRVKTDKKPQSYCPLIRSNLDIGMTQDDVTVCPKTSRPYDQRDESGQGLFFNTYRQTLHSFNDQAALDLLIAQANEVKGCVYYILRDENGMVADPDMYKHDPCREKINSLLARQYGTNINNLRHAFNRQDRAQQQTSRIVSPTLIVRRRKSLSGSQP